MSHADFCCHNPIYVNTLGQEFDNNKPSFEKISEMFTMSIMSAIFSCKRQPLAAGTSLCTSTTTTIFVGFSKITMAILKNQ